MDFVFRIGLILLLVLLNGYFVASEFALVSVRRTRVDELAKKGSRSAKLLQKALEDLNRYISATQLGITLVSLALGWVGEPAIVRFIAPLFTFLPQGPALVTTNVIASSVAFLIITFIDIVLGEQVPKSIALQRPESLSLFIISPLIIFSDVFQPFIWILNISGQLVLKVFGFSTRLKNQSIYSEDEIKMLLSQSSQGGEIPAREVEMVYNVFRLGDISVKHVMVPRTDIVAFNIATPLADVIKRIERNPHSRFPVFEKSIDTIIGFIHVKDLYRELLKQEDEEKTLASLRIVREIIIVPEVKKIDAVLQEMRKKHLHMAAVNDEFGGTAGLVTLEDIMESLVGEIEDEFDQPLKAIVKQKDESYLIQGQALIEEFQEKFHFPVKGQGYTTIGGLVFGILGHEPHIGDVVQIANVELEVAELTGKRIKVLRLRKEDKKNK